MKSCSRCYLVKPLSDFHNQKITKDGKQSHCRACQAIAAAKYRAANKEKISQAKKIYRADNLEAIAARDRRYREAKGEALIAKKLEYSRANTEKRKAYDAANAEKIRIRDAAYRKKNADRIKARCLSQRRVNLPVANAKQNAKYRTDPLFAMRKNCRSRILDAVRRSGFTKRSRTSELLGCTWEEYKTYLESLFVDGMSWENRGKYGWHIDHKIPLVSAKTQEQIEKLFHFSNTQPLWAEDNYRKGCRVG